jgi:hypothetical protein
MLSAIQTLKGAVHTTAVAVSPLCAVQLALLFSACNFCLALAFGCLYSVAVACSGRDARAHALQQRDV